MKFATQLTKEQYNTIINNLREDHACYYQQHQQNIQKGKMSPSEAFELFESPKFGLNESKTHVAWIAKGFTFNNTVLINKQSMVLMYIGVRSSHLIGMLYGEIKNNRLLTYVTTEPEWAWYDNANSVIMKAIKSPENKNNPITILSKKSILDYDEIVSEFGNTGKKVFDFLLTQKSHHYYFIKNKVVNANSDHHWWMVNHDCFNPSNELEKCFWVIHGPKPYNLARLYAEFDTQLITKVRNLTLW